MPCFSILCLSQLEWMPNFSCELVSLFVWEQLDKSVMSYTRKEDCASKRCTICKISWNTAQLLRVVIRTDQAGKGTGEHKDVSSSFFQFEKVITTQLERPDGFKILLFNTLVNTLISFNYAQCKRTRSSKSRLLLSPYLVALAVRWVSGREAVLSCLLFLWVHLSFSWPFFFFLII